MERALTPIHLLQNRIAILKDHAGFLLRMHQERGQRISPKVPILLETDQFILKTIDTVEDRTRVFRLRYQVFHRELMNKRLPFGFDIDAFDFKCDHLAIIDRASGEVIGTYRMLCSLFVDRFYSADEFDLSAIYGLKGVKLELGRACVDERFRNGAVLGLLWRGIGEYVRKTGAEYLLGCSSVHTMESDDLRCLTQHLRTKGHFAEAQWCPTLPAFEWVEAGEKAPTADVEARVKHLFPQLLASYLRAGAKVCGGPAIDRAMKCSDYLTLLKISDMNPSFAKRYEVGATQS